MNQQQQDDHSSSSSLDPDIDAITRASDAHAAHLAVAEARWSDVVVQVERARREGRTWAEIAAALRISTRTAQERFDPDTPVRG